MLLKHLSNGLKSIIRYELIQRNLFEISFMNNILTEEHYNILKESIIKLFIECIDEDKTVLKFTFNLNIIDGKVPLLSALNSMENELSSIKIDMHDKAGVIYGQFIFDHCNLQGFDPLKAFVATSDTVFLDYSRSEDFISEIDVVFTSKTHKFNQ